MGCGSDPANWASTDPWAYWRGEGESGGLTPAWSTSQNSASSNSSSRNYSGLPVDYRNQLLESVMPTLNQSVSGMVGNADTYANQANSQYAYQMNQVLQPAIRKAINDLAKRGVLSSTVASDSVGNVASEAMKDAGTKGYETAMQAALMKFSIPQVLSQIADLGKFSEGTSSSSSSSLSTSYSEDPSSIWNILLGG